MVPWSPAADVRAAHQESDIAALGSFLDAHVLEFAVVEDFAAFQAFYKLSVFVAAHNLHTWMLASSFLVYALRGRGRLGGHKSGRVLETEGGGTQCTGISGILERLRGLSSPFTGICDEFFAFAPSNPGAMMTHSEFQARSCFMQVPQYSIVNPRSRPRPIAGRHCWRFPYGGRLKGRRHSALVQFEGSYHKGHKVTRRQPLPAKPIVILRALRG